MKNVLFVFALLFFAPVQNFAIVSFSTEKTVETTKKTVETPKKNKWTNVFLGLALGFVIGGFLIIKATPIFAAVCLGIGLIFCIVTIVLLIQDVAKQN